MFARVSAGGWLVLLGCWLAGPALAAPRLEVQNPEVDLGVIPRGKVIEARFVLRNTGDEVLRILRAEPG